MGGTLNAFPTNVTVDWKDLGFLTAVPMRDLWSHAELGPASQSFSSMVPAHGARLFKVKVVGQPPVPPSQIYGAETATLYGGARLSSCSTCASGHKGYSFGTPTSTTIQVPLHAGSNYAPNLDSIIISPPTVF